MAKRKQSTKSNNGGIPFHPDFVEPTETERHAAIGSFPGATHTASTRKAMLNEAQLHLDDDRAPSLVESFSDLDEAKLYEPAGKRAMTTMAVPKPRDEQDWLACVPEEGQTFDEYVRFLTTRSGRFSRIANVGYDHIVLLPIVRSRSVSDSHWPDHGVPLEPLVPLAKAFFHRPVRLFPPAVLCDEKPSGDRMNPSQGVAISFTMKFPTASSDHNGRQQYLHATVTGRKDLASQRVQLNLEDVLYALKTFREDESLLAADGGEPLPNSSFCVMAITMDDLYMDPTDLFVSGMAFGGDKVAVFSFSRYHPHIKMHPGRWFDFGYGTKHDNYSYYEEAHINPIGARKKAKKNLPALTPEPPTFDNMTRQAQTEFFRRCAKILVHELGHLYGLDHCIFNRCIMNGTGHLVEDFLAPFHLCPVCLRKLQWRLGFSVVYRYKKLADSLRGLGMDKEEKWIGKQLETLESA
ncbi:Archaemetzincin-2 [Seminavis robusta]|uniref:Archaemetzincin-2 n=1 Tax=Seminavis robusta TaxID=568900 RepID=A0A9N8ERL5_9STRA|nr:Archaemetzincin-2 [Seminavis robusta]|eukprot:Sro1685_g291040.1 Archaemetzincin-2 (465) ;mRNA; r:5387-6781